MGRKGKWFGAVKKVFSPESREKNDQKKDKSKKNWGFGKSKLTDHDSSSLEACEGPVAADPPPPIAAEEVTLIEAERNHAHSVMLPTPAAVATATEPTEILPQASVEVVRLPLNATKFPGKSREEIAAIKIQTAFRGYLARRALRALRGLVRLKSLLDGNAVKRQSATTLRCMQTLSKVQAQIRVRRIRMSEENQALQRQLQLKRERELEALRASMGEEWDDSLQSKEQIEASILSKHEASVRRERAMAYAFSHQWKNSSRSVNPLFTDPNNPHWGWSWLERWMSSRPWETRSVTEKELNNDHASARSATCSVGGEVKKPYDRQEITNVDKPSPVIQKSNTPGRWQSPSTPPTKASSATGKIKPPIPVGEYGPQEDDSRSLISLQSERIRRHSIAGSSVRDDESLASSPSIPSYMAPTASAKAKSRFQSPASDKLETPERGSFGSVRKRLSFPSGDKINSSPGGVRRHSGPPKVDLSSVKDVLHSEQCVINGDGR
uniref:Protein IQ-DOMAIN 1 n=1 Tax=Anthurium amnicola TaxID=1678845 RepID=A0A1D1Y7G8_9ARAE